MTDETQAQRSLRCGAEFPFDGDRPEIDLAHRVARGIFYDLSDRYGIKQELRQISLDVAITLVDDVADIVREAFKQSPQFPTVPIDPATGWPVGAGPMKPENE